MIVDEGGGPTAVPAKDHTSRNEASEMPAAGPHARPDLIDPEKTPGSGMYPAEDDTNPSPTS
jgi:hypothetical protein